MHKFVIFTVLLICLNFNYAYGEVIKDIEINGNKRISDETILVFSGIKSNKEINPKDLDLKLIVKIYNKMGNLILDPHKQNFH